MLGGIVSKILGNKKCGVSTIKSDKQAMKTITVFSAMVFCSVALIAQIPNGGFEIWENYFDGPNVYQKPDLWVGALPNSSLTNSFSIEKNFESFPPGTGQFSMKIQPDLPNEVRGVALSRDDFSNAMTNNIPNPSFAINYKPSTLNLYYKYFPEGGDTMYVQIFFYKNGNVISHAYFGTDLTVSNWTALEIPIAFTTSDLPDSASILFVTGAYVQHSGSILYVDNVSFDGFVSSISETTTEQLDFDLFPNPASYWVSLTFSNYDGEGIISIYNALGTEVKVVAYSSSNPTIDISDLSNGLYIVQLKSKHSREFQRLIIQR